MIWLTRWLRVLSRNRDIIRLARALGLFLLLILLFLKDFEGAGLLALKLVDLLK